MPKRTRAEREQHLDLMANSLANGDDPADIARMAASKFGISERAARNELAEIRRRWAAEGADVLARKNAACSLAKAIRRREALYSKALDAGEFRVALDVDRDRCNLEGLYPAVQLEHGHKGVPGAPPIAVENVKMVVYKIPDNGRGDPDPELAEEQPATSPTTPADAACQTPQPS